MSEGSANAVHITKRERGGRCPPYDTFGMRDCTAMFLEFGVGVLTESLQIGVQRGFYDSTNEQVIH